MLGCVGRGHHLLLARLPRAGAGRFRAPGSQGPDLHHFGAGVQHLVHQALAVPKLVKDGPRRIGQDSVCCCQVNFTSGKV